MRQTKPIRFHRNGHPETGMEPASMISAENFTTKTQRELTYTAFASADGRASAGVWECAPCRIEVERFGIDELMVMLAGSITLTHKDGTSDTFTTGDTFLIPADFSGVMEADETSRAYWMIYEPPAAGA